MWDLVDVCRRVRHSMQVAIVRNVVRMSRGVRHIVIMSCRMGNRLWSETLLRHNVISMPVIVGAVVMNWWGLIVRLVGRMRHCVQVSRRVRHCMIMISVGYQIRVCRRVWDEINMSVLVIVLTVSGLTYT